jgi:hypothetical protein
MSGDETNPRLKDAENKKHKIVHILKKGRKKIHVPRELPASINDEALRPLIPDELLLDFSALNLRISLLRRRTGVSPNGSGIFAGPRFLCIVNSPWSKAGLPSAAGATFSSFVGAGGGVAGFLCCDCDSVGGFEVAGAWS